MPGDYLLILYNTASGSAGKHVKSPSFLPWGYLNALGFFFQISAAGVANKSAAVKSLLWLSPCQIWEQNQTKEVTAQLCLGSLPQNGRSSLVYCRTWGQNVHGGQMWRFENDGQRSEQDLLLCICWIFFCSFSLTLISQSDTEKDKICIWRLTNILYDIILYFKSLFWQ